MKAGCACVEPHGRGGRVPGSKGLFSRCRGAGGGEHGD